MNEETMNEEITQMQTQRESEMIAVIVEIVDGARGLIRDWPLLENAEQALRNGGPDGLALFYRASVEQPGSRGTWIKATLQVHNKKTLESEYKRFMAIYAGSNQ